MATKEVIIANKTTLVDIVRAGDDVTDKSLNSGVFCGIRNFNPANSLKYDAGGVLQGFYLRKPEDSSIPTGNFNPTAPSEKYYLNRTDAEARIVYTYDKVDWVTGQDTSILYYIDYGIASLGFYTSDTISTYNKSIFYSNPNFNKIITLTQAQLFTPSYIDNSTTFFLVLNYHRVVVPSGDYTKEIDESRIYLSVLPESSLTEAGEYTQDGIKLYIKLYKVKYSNVVLSGGNIVSASVTMSRCDGYGEVDLHTTYTDNTQKEAKSSIMNTMEAVRFVSKYSDIYSVDNLNNLNLKYNLASPDASYFVPTSNMAPVEIEMTSATNRTVRLVYQKLLSELGTEILKHSKFRHTAPVSWWPDPVSVYPNLNKVNPHETKLSDLASDLITTGKLDVLYMNNPLGTQRRLRGLPDFTGNYKVASSYGTDALGTDAANYKMVLDHTAQLESTNPHETRLQDIKSSGTGYISAGTRRITDIVNPSGNQDAVTLLVLNNYRDTINTTINNHIIDYGTSSSNPHQTYLYQLWHNTIAASGGYLERTYCLLTSSDANDNTETSSNRKTIRGLFTSDVDLKTGSFVSKWSKGQDAVNLTTLLSHTTAQNPHLMKLSELTSNSTGIMDADNRSILNVTKVDFTSWTSVEDNDKYAATVGLVKTRGYEIKAPLDTHIGYTSNNPHGTTLAMLLAWDAGGNILSNIGLATSGTHATSVDWVTTHLSSTPNINGTSSTTFKVGTISESLDGTKVTFKSTTSGTPLLDLQVNDITCRNVVASGTVSGAVYNDYADFLESEEEIEYNIEYGKVYCKTKMGFELSKKYCQMNMVGIASDTYGISTGIKYGTEAKKEIPFAVSGIVLAYVDRIYDNGTPLTSNKNGYLTKIRLLDKILHPERIIATFYKEESGEVWHKRKVNGRCWVKVR
jgi:hypothetical protein